MPGRADGRNKPVKPMTIHSFVQSGNLAEVQKLIQENELLLNSRNAVMAHTPLHIAAGYDSIDIIKYLLDWHGAESIELEARNMFGETPLHMAAKSGSTASVQLLISRGAFVGAKTNHGMTPLHLAAFWSIQAKDCSTVRTLLENHADCSSRDNDGMAPVDYILDNQRNDELRGLLLHHAEVQEQLKATEACGKMSAKMAELEAAMSTIVGLHDLKLQLRKWAKGILLDERRRALGLRVAARRLPHMAFLGNPGTGKTMVARLLGRLLHAIGVLPTDKVSEVQRTDLVGEFVGHTGPKTRRKIKEAEGGILFIDEAYRLIPMQKADDKDYGLEALEEIMSVMDNGEVVVIFAGYSEPMKRVMTSNEGFRRRVTKFFYFDDFNTRELAEIAHIKMKNQADDSLLYGFRLHPSCTVDVITDLMDNTTTEKVRKEMNGGLIDAMLVNARENLDLRLDFTCDDVSDLLTMKLEDLEAGLRLVAS